MYHFHDFRGLQPVTADHLVLIDVREAEIPVGSDAEKFLFECLERCGHVTLATGNAGTIHFDRFRSEKFSLINYPKCFFVNYYNYNDPNEPLLPTENFQYHFCCFNNKAKSIRVQLVDSLFEHNLNNISLITWRSGKALPNIYGQQAKYFDPSITIRHDLQNANEEQMTWKEIVTPAKDYDKCAIDLVTESIYSLFNTDTVFLTEKTVKPLWYGKFFLCLAVPGFHSWIKSLGFELYDELFDYSFDSVKNSTLRYRGYLSNVLRISELSLRDLEQLYRDSADKIKHNAHLARTIECNVPEVLRNSNIDNDSIFRFSEEDKIKYIKDIPPIFY